MRRFLGQLPACCVCFFNQILEQVVVVSDMLSVFKSTYLNVIQGIVHVHSRTY
jgi:hypothetical protein